MKQKVNKRKILISCIAILASLLIVGIVFAATSLNKNNYVVDVMKESATSKDDNLQISENIIKETGKTYFDSKELNYEIELKNLIQEDKNTEVAFLLDSSYSMQTNDNLNIGKAKAKELAQGILSQVKDVKVSVSSNAESLGTIVSNKKTNILTNNINEINTRISNIPMTSINSCSQGLDYAYDTFSKNSATTDTNKIQRYIIVITDGTDDVSEKMLSLKNADPNLQIITILIDVTSTAYINNGVPVCGKVYLLNSNEDANNISENVEILDVQKIYDEINRIDKNITVTNKFFDLLVENFDISDFTVTAGEITTTKNDNGDIDGYTWKVDKIAYKKAEKLSFKIKLKNKDIDAGIIFKEFSTNKEQNVTYSKYDNEETIHLNGTDERAETDTTIIKICKGYNLKIKAVNELNKDLVVEGVKFTVIGTKQAENGDIEEVCNLTKTTNSQGYITITPEEEKALRGDGKITYTVIPDVTGLLGYSGTNSIMFDVINNRITRMLEVDDYNGIGIPSPDETNRLVEVTMPINTQRLDFEVRNEELNNSNIVLSGSKFILSQPLLNDKYKMEKLEGVTDQAGTIHFNPTVMTKNGTYTYYLEQETVANSYKTMEMVRIDVTFVNGKVTEVTRKYNTNVDAERISDDHILVTARNESVVTNPFNLQINLKDDTTNTPLGPVTYLVKTIYSNGTSRAELLATDPATGSLNTNIAADGNFQIEITEQAPMPGYKENTKTTTITASRANNQITIWNVDTNNAIVQLDPNHENMEVNFTSQKKSEQNIVKISLADIDEPDVSVGKNVAYTLKDNETGTVYGGQFGNPAVSDKNGELLFTIANKPQGTHQYTLTVDKTTIPNDYDTNQVEENILINIGFDQDGYINDTNNIVNDNTIIESHYSKIVNSTSVEYTYFIKIGYKLKYDNTAVFKIKLLDRETMTKNLKDAKYNIEIKWDANGVQRTKTITERKTNDSGEITTRITKSNDVQIEVTQVGSSIGYLCDITTQEIHLNFLDDGRILIEQTPYDRGITNTIEPNQGIAVNDTGNEVLLNSSREIVYQHLNRQTSTENTYINLTVNKLDKDSQAYVDGIILGISSNKEGASVPNSSNNTVNTSSPVNPLVDKNENDLDLMIVTGQKGTAGSISIDYQAYLQDQINEEIIRAPGIGVDGNEIIYNMEISELQVDPNSSTGYSKKSGATVKLRLIFRYKEGTVQLTNVESYYGNNLVKDKTFSSVKDDTLGVYLANISLDLWTNYDEVRKLKFRL